MATDRSGTHLGPYRIETLLGRGGMGEVYRATDTRKGRVVALKLLSPAVAGDGAFRDRFLRESRVAASINDPHVIPIHDWGEIDGLLFIDMRLVDGRDLREVLVAGPLPAERALAIVGQIADALDAAHANALVHRDVKPDNILVDNRDFAYLVDFGLAQADTDTRLTSTGQAIGSFGYMAPERFGDHAVGGAADVYALTCVLYECLAGAHPFASATTIERLIAAHLALEPPRLGTPVDEVIARGMAKDPAHRYRSAGAMVAAARAAALGPARGAPPTVIPPPHQPSAVWAPTHVAATDPRGVPPQTMPVQRRSPFIPIAIATIVVLLIGIGVVGWALLRGAGSDAEPAAASSTQTATPQTATPQTATPQTATSQTSAAPVPTTTAPPPPPPPQRGAGDLGLATPISTPACDGTGIVVVGNAVNPGSYATEVQGYLDRFPGSSYLRTDQSCSSLRQSLDGNPIYAVYQVAGSTLGDICSLRNSIGGDAYGKWLNNTSDPTQYLTC